MGVGSFCEPSEAVDEDDEDDEDDGDDGDDEDDEVDDAGDSGEVEDATDVAIENAAEESDAVAALSVEWFASASDAADGAAAGAM